MDSSGTGGGGITQPSPQGEPWQSISLSEKQVPALQQLFEGNHREINDNADGIAWELLRATCIWERNREGWRPWTMDQTLCVKSRGLLDAMGKGCG